MRALSFNDGQIGQLKASVAMLPPELRADLVRLVVGFMEVEGDLASPAVFDRALRFALDSVHSRNGEDTA
jgi:hypothetical protein